MAQSSLTNVVIAASTSNYTRGRTNKVLKITPHHMAGNLTVESCGRQFQAASRQASSNYGIGTDGRIGLYVAEENRSWCSGSPANDHQAITVEIANDGGAPDWHVSDTAINKFIELSVDICQRYGISRLNYTGSASGNLTRHNMFQATTCPGPYLQSKLPWIAEQVNARLSAPITAYEPSGLVQKGAYSGAVLWIQQRLNLYGYGLAEDGDFGPATDAAVRSFQAVKGLDADGIVGPFTIAALKVNPAPAQPAEEELGRGDEGDGVRWIQERLNVYGYGLDVDGDFGPLTDSAVRDFQGRQGLDVDGIVGPLTRAELKKDPAVTPPADPDPVPTALYVVQAGAFADKANADALTERLKKAGFDAYIKIAN